MSRVGIHEHVRARELYGLWLQREVFVKDVRIVSHQAEGTRGIRMDGLIDEHARKSAGELLRLALVALAVIGCGLALEPRLLAVSTLHSFQGGKNDGFLPNSSLVLDGSGFLYGTTTYGGLDFGTVFRVRTDGSGFQLLHSFDGSPADGAHPVSTSPPVLDGSGYLYGITFRGGTSGQGTVFRVKTDGSDFRILHSFAGGPGDTVYPRSLVDLDESGYLYGAGDTVFRIRTDGSGFQLLPSIPKTFSVLDSSGYLYGARRGTGWDLDALFRVKTDGTGFQILHSFDAPVDGAHPSSFLALDGAGYLYGTTADGGAANRGTVFRIKTDGTGFQVLHSLAGDSADGVRGPSSVLLDGSGSLYGTMTVGKLEKGAVFRLGTDGTGFQLLHTFTGAADGAFPVTGLIRDANGRLYGTTREGGGPVSRGTIFALDPCPPPPPPVVTLLSGTNPTCEGNSVTLGTNAGYASYLWSTGETTSTITVSSAASTALWLAVTSAGCDNLSVGSLGIEAYASLPAPLISAPAVTTAGWSFIVSVPLLDKRYGAKYKWTLTGDGSITSGQETASIRIKAGAVGRLTVQVTESNLCGTREASAHVQVLSEKQLALQGGKVSVQVQWKSPSSGETGWATPFKKAERYGYFYFSSPNDPQIVVKVLDFGANSPYLLFWAGLTDFEYTITFTNMSTGAMASFQKPAGSTDGGASNTDLPQTRAVIWDAGTGETSPLPRAGAIAESDGAVSGIGSPGKLVQAAPIVQRLPGRPGPATGNEIYLAWDKVAVSVEWRSQYTGKTGWATPVVLGDAFCYFYISDPENPEIFVKVVPWGLPSQLFAAGLSDYEYSVTFRNVRTGESTVFRKPAGTYSGFGAKMNLGEMHTLTVKMTGLCSSRAGVSSSPQIEFSGSPLTGRVLDGVPVTLGFYGIDSCGGRYSYCFYFEGCDSVSGGLCRLTLSSDRTVTALSDFCGAPCPFGKIDSFTTTPDTISPGESVKLEWKGCGTGGWVGPVIPCCSLPLPSGTMTVNPAQTTTYTLHILGVQSWYSSSGSHASAEKTVTVRTNREDRGGPAPK